MKEILIHPATLMIGTQLEWAKENNIDNLFFSVEFLRRRGTLEQLAKKLNNKYNKQVNGKC